MSKHKHVLIAGAAASGVLVLITAIVTVSGIRKATAMHESMQRAFTSLQGYFQRNPFPNAANVEAEAGKLETRKQWHRTLRDAISREAVHVEGEHSPGSFANTCEDTINLLRAQAPKSEGGVPIIAENFNFGFDRYDRTQRGQPAAQKDVPRLLRQLEMVKRLVLIVYETELIKLEQVLREEFDVSESGGATRVTRGRGGRRTTSSASAGVTLDRVEAGPLENAPMEIDRQRFGFVFLVREAALFSLIDRLNAMWPYAQISKLEFKKTEGDVVFEKPQATPAVVEAGASGIVQPPAGKTSRIVSGALREAPVRVAMTIDIYTLGAEDDAEQSD